jgi:sorting nexin-29
MEWMKIPDKLIRLTRMTMNTTQAKVKIDNKLSAKFEFNTGVKQGEGSSAALFIVALHSVIKSIDQRGTVYTKSSQIYAYADDIVIITRSRVKIIEMYKEIEETARKIGLAVNERKTKYMIMSTRHKTQDLKVEGHLFTEMSSFKYLGNMINN